jgi:phenylpropionate dioxygenase-like ring-hydroxylating dioxygenase large terminal subunit
MSRKSSFLRNVWYYALPSCHLKRGETLTKIFLNEAILFGRTQEGDIFARQNSLLEESPKGSIQVEDEFRPYIVQETQGNIWIYMGQTMDSTPTEAVPQVPIFQNQPYQAACIMQFPSDIDNTVMGLLDPAHIAFVHQSWWWRSPTTLQKVVKTFDPSLHGFTMRRHALEQQTFFYRLVGDNPEVEISFRLPGIRIEYLATSQNTVCSLTATTPISDAETEVTTLLYTTLPWFPILKPLMLYFMNSFLGQDKEVLRKQGMGLAHNPPITLVGDADAQSRWYYRLKRDLTHATSSGSLFVNPLKTETLSWRS